MIIAELHYKIKNKMEKIGKTEILPGVYAVRTSLWFSRARVLVFGDVHIGYEEALSRRGYLVPHVQFKETLEILDEILSVVDPKTVVINGDLKHEFGQISEQEWMDTSKFIDKLSEHCAKIVLVRGNHDTILGPIAKKKKLGVVDFYCFGKVCVLHGNKVIETKKILSAELIVMGNEHPAVVLEEGAKREKYKCFLLGKWKKRRLIAMPSFLPTIEGTNIKQENLLSPYLHQNLDNFEVFIVGDGVYSFGKLKYI